MRDRIDDGAIRLRRYTIDDLDPMRAAARESIADVAPWMIWLDEDYSREDARAWIEASKTAWEAGDAFEYLVESASDGRFVGGCGINLIRRADATANLGYWVRSPDVGRGIAPAAVRALAAAAFEDLGLERIELVIAVGNTRSMRVAEKLGAVREGVLHRRLRLPDGQRDAVMYAILRRDAR